MLTFSLNRRFFIWEDYIIFFSGAGSGAYSKFWQYITLVQKVLGGKGRIVHDGIMRRLARLDAPGRLEPLGKSVL